MLRKNEVTNVLNDIYEEGLKAHAANHFLERHFLDLTFGASCDGCKKEIEFLLFVCLGCRNHSICEACYFKQLVEPDQEVLEDEDDFFEDYLSNSAVSDAEKAEAVLRRSQERISKAKTMKEHSNKHMFLRCYDF